MLPIPTPPTDQQSCSCLATLYLCLEDLRAKEEEISFPSGLTLLRDIIGKTRDIIQCPICPNRSVWAMQNAQLLNTLLLCITVAYRTIVNSIDTEAHRADQTNESKTLWFGEPGPELIDGLGEVSHRQPSLSISTSPREWQSLAKRAVKADIFGPSALSSFVSLLKLMQDRQTQWHSDCHSCPTFAIHQSHHGDGKDPPCVIMVKDTRKMLDQIAL